MEFSSIMKAIPQDRRREIVRKMTELCENELDLDFISAFLACLLDADDQVRVQAIHGLENSDDRTIIRPLLDRLLTDDSVNVRATAAASLGKFGALAQEGKIMNRDAERIRIALLSVINRSNETIEPQRRAIESVATFDCAEVEETIQKAYDDGNSQLKQSAIYAMGQSSNEKWLSIVIRDTQDPDPAIRYEAVGACGNLGNDDTSPHIVALLNDEDSLVQIASAQALGVIGGSLAKRALEQCLLTGDDVLEEAAKAALKNLEFDEDPLGLSYEA